MGDYLKRWGFTPQKPVKRAYEQDPKKIAQWLETDYPAIEARARKEKAEIHLGDETGIQNTAYTEKGSSPKGKAPVINLNAIKSSVNMISAISNRGTARFMLYREKMTAKVLIKFLSRLIQNASRKIFLILDNLKMHHSQAFSKWLEKKQKKSRCFSPSLRTQTKSG